MHLLQADMKAAFASFREDRSAPQQFTYSPSPLAPHLTAYGAYRLHEKYLADKFKQPERLWVSDTPAEDSLSSPSVIAKIIAQDSEARSAGAKPKLWLSEMR